MKILRNTLGTLLFVACLGFNHSTTQALSNWDCDFSCAGVTSIADCWLTEYPQAQDSCTPEPWYYPQLQSCYDLADELCALMADPWSSFVTSVDLTYHSQPGYPTTYGEIEGGFQCTWNDEYMGCPF